MTSSEKVCLLATRPRALGEDALEQVVRAHWFDTWRAVGALAARRRISPEDALALMRAEAFRTGRSLPDITTDILRDRPRRP
ncbi:MULTISPECIES: ANTAR domain-containing protein [Streptomyces]|uniref:ANTAR domain-containing protein n=1 Tax=Streptomyces TaxID=1883 RepID=UPI0037DA6780